MEFRFVYITTLILFVALVSTTTADEIKNFTDSPINKSLSVPLEKGTQDARPISPNTDLEKSLILDFKKDLIEEKARPVKPMMDNTLEINRRERDCQQRNEANRASCFSRCSTFQGDNGRYGACLASCQGYQEYNCR